MKINEGLTSCFIGRRSPKAVGYLQHPLRLLARGQLPMALSHPLAAGPGLYPALPRQDGSSFQELRGLLWAQISSFFIVFPIVFHQKALKPGPENEGLSPQELAPALPRAVARSRGFDRGRARGARLLRPQALSAPSRHLNRLSVEGKRSFGALCGGETLSKSTAFACFSPRFSPFCMLGGSCCSSTAAGKEQRRCRWRQTPTCSTRSMPRTCGCWVTRRGYCSWAPVGSQERTRRSSRG